MPGFVIKLIQELRSDAKIVSLQLIFLQSYRPNIEIKCGVCVKSKVSSPR